MLVLKVQCLVQGISGKYLSFQKFHLVQPSGQTRGIPRGLREEMVRLRSVYTTVLACISQ